MKVIPSTGNKVQRLTFKWVGLFTGETPANPPAATEFLEAPDPPSGVLHNWRYREFSANDPTDIYLDGSNVTPLFWDDFAALYKYFTVTSSKIFVTYSGDSDNSQTKACGVWVDDSLTSYTPGGILSPEEFLMNDRIKTKILKASADGNANNHGPQQTVSMAKMASPHKAMHKDQWDEDLRGVTASNGTVTSKVRFKTGLVDMYNTAVQPVAFHAKIVIVYNCLFFEPVWVT
jgi:hypothetical protein